MSMSQVFAPIRGPSQVVEREILRVVATLRDEDSEGAFERARKETLSWASKRTAGALPKAAWEGDGFDHLAGGRPILARSVNTDVATLWALRADDPDKEIPARTWITEVAIGLPNKGLSQMSIRQMASSSEMDLAINPHVPRVAHQVANQCGLRAGRFPITDVHKCVESDDDLNKLFDLLESQDRRLPVIVASGDERTPTPERPLIDTASLAIATLGLAHVFVLPAKHSYVLSEKFDKSRSVFHGAVRMYRCGFNHSADPREHPLFLGHKVSINPDDCEREIRQLVAHESVRRTRLGHDVLSFSDVADFRSEAAREAAQRREIETARVIHDTQITVERRISVLEQEIEARKSDVDALEDQVKSAQSERDRSFDLATQEEERARSAEERARNAEATLYGLNVHVVKLRRMLSQQQIDPDRGLELPRTWEELAEWCNEHLAGRLVLAPQARRGIKKAMFDDPELAGRCLLWLSSTYRDIRIDGIGDPRDAHAHIRTVTDHDGTAISGVENSRCGTDEFYFDYEDGRLKADWHVKNGNARDREHCLRIYYCYDEAKQQIVVADMPGHRKTGAT